MKTDSSTKSDRLGNTGVIAGIAAALVLILALILVALYINYHPTAASSLYLIQVSTECVKHALISIYVHIKHNFSVLDFFFFLATQELLAFLEVSEATTWLHGSGRRRS